MNKKPNSDQPLRYRVTVPLKDADVINWMVEQTNPSFSIRMLIRAFIAKYGITDVTCLPVTAGLDIDLQNPDMQAENLPRQAPVKKTSVSLTDVKQGLSQPVQKPAQPQSVPVQSPAAPVQPKPAASPGSNSGYVPTDISDLM